MLEELSATHHMSYDELGNMPNEVVHALWESYYKRKRIDDLTENRQRLVMSLYSNGMIGGDDLKSAVADIDENWRKGLTAIIEGKDIEDLDEGADGYAGMDAPMFQRKVSPPG